MASFVRLLFFHGIIYHALVGVHCLPEALPLEKNLPGKYTPLERTSLRTCCSTPRVCDIWILASLKLKQKHAQKRMNPQETGSTDERIELYIDPSFTSCIEYFTPYFQLKNC